ncbi:TPA: hypothetical protein QEM66_000157 [Pseudomonas putida]|nr:hypothetical protein [Pseudomonas putida]
MVDGKVIGAVGVSTPVWAHDDPTSQAVVVSHPAQRSRSSR